jgi:hypothetical protein
MLLHKIIQVPIREFRHTELDVCHSMGISTWRHESHGIVNVKQDGAGRLASPLHY